MNKSALRHLFRQAELGEFALHKEQASKLSAEEFSKIFDAPIRFWGRNNFYRCVEVDGIEYLWKTSTGEYDGWNMYAESGILRETNNLDEAKGI